MVRSLSIALVICSVSVCAFANDSVSVVFKNASSITITNLYLSKTKEDNWGADQLGDGESDTISPKEQFTLSKIVPSVYDLKIVDEDEDDCIVSSIKIRENEVVTLTDELLIACQMASAAAELEDEADAEE